MRISCLLRFGLCALVIAFPSTATAEEPGVESNDGHLLVPTKPVEHAPGYHNHDGFYFRFGTGLGGYIETLGPKSGPIAGRVSATGATVELAVGGTVAPGIVVGVGSYLERLLASDLQTSDDLEAPIPNRLLPSFRDTLLVGPFCDWYFDPRQGLHLQAAAGLFHMARVRYTPGNFDDGDYSATGAGGLIGFGQEWFVSAENNIGVTTQLAFAWAQGQKVEGERWTHYIVATPTFVFTWTHH